MAALEETLGIRLLQRTTRRLSLTDAGAAYYARAGDALAGLDALYEAWRLGLPEESSGRLPARKPMRSLESAWQRPDDGIWEVRSGRRHFVHSKMMAWVAVDRSIRVIEEFSAPEANHGRVGQRMSGVLTTYHPGRRTILTTAAMISASPPVQVA